MHVHTKIFISGKVCRIENGRFFIKTADGGMESYSLEYYRYTNSELC